MIWNSFCVEKQHTGTYLFICPFLNVNTFFSDFFWCMFGYGLRNILAKRWQSKHLLWKAALKLENLPETGLL